MRANDSITTYNQLASRLLITHLFNLGCRNFFISPGSRSTPITLEIARRNDLNKTIHFDERGVSFAALGAAKATLTPSVLICTSGTAGANYLPAVIEASLDRIPLIVLTADRPPEHQNINANQTINQLNLFGSFVRHFENIEPPDKTFDLDKFIEQLNSAFSKTNYPTAGPIHLNFMFREPLVPKRSKGNLDSIYKKYMFEKVKRESAPKIQTTELNKLTDNLKKSKSVFLVCGYQKESSLSKSLNELADNNSWLLWSDIRSNFQSNSDSRNYFDLSLLNKKMHTNEKLTVLHFGGNLISKRYLQFIESTNIESYYHIDTDDYIYNPHHKVSDKLTVNPKDLIKKLLKENFKSGKLFTTFSKLNNKIEKTINQKTDYSAKLTEISAARLISKNIKKNSSLFLASSMPVRDFDMFSKANNKKIKIFANRGASGIDGAVSSFFGTLINSASGTALLGDLSFLHDLNSLKLFENINKSAVLVVINNSGGGIFSFLPIVNQKDSFEKYFAAIHKSDFSKLQQFFGFNYFNPTGNDEFVKIYNKAQKTKGLTLIEIKTDRQQNLNFHKRIYKIISRL